MCVKTFVKLKFPSHTKCSFEVQGRSYGPEGVRFCVIIEISVSFKSYYIHI